VSVGADRFQMWKRRKIRNGAARFALFDQTLFFTVSVPMRTQFAELVSTRVQSVCAMIQQGKTSKTRIKNTHFGVVIGVVEALKQPYSPVNKGNKRIG
jgi:hypothetical protein